MPRGNFEDFSTAFITVFQVLTIENWQTVMYQSMRASRGSFIMKSITAIYYVTWIFIGNFILLNLFLAIVIDSFSEVDKETTGDQEEVLEAAQKAQEYK